MAIVVKRSVTSGEANLKAEMLDLFYPVGSYYETSDTSFDPNTAWGGTWVEDTDGRVLVALDSGTFDTVGDTGGLEKTNQAFYAPALNVNSAQDAGRNYVNAQKTAVETWLTAGGSSSMTLETDVQGVGGDIRTNGTANVEVSYFKYTSTNLQPYLVVKRWHRTA